MSEVFEIEDSKMIEQYFQGNYSLIKRAVLADLMANKSESALLTKYSRQDMVNILEDPQRNAAKVRELSQYIYIVSSHYRRLVDYLAFLLTYNYNLIPTDIPEMIDLEKYRQEYMYVAGECDKYNMKHEASKAIKVAIRDGVFFGIAFESAGSFYLRQIEPKYCFISGIEDGAYTFSFDLNYFSGKKEILEMYGTEFIRAWDRYKGNKEKGIAANRKLRYFEPVNGFCVKADESDPYHSLPFFTGLLTSIFDIEDYKMLQKAKKENDNYKVLALELPTDENGIPLLDYNENLKYYEHVAQQIRNESVGVCMTPFPIKDYDFANNKTSDSDAVNAAEKAFFNGSGVSGGLFLSGITSSSAIGLSVKPDEQVAYSLLLQFQRQINKKLKKMNLDYTFKVEFLLQSIFSQGEVTDRYAKAGMYGLPTKTYYAASIGLSPLDAIRLTQLEESVLGLSSSVWTHPLVSSNVQGAVSDSDEGGRPTSEEAGTVLSEAGEITREYGSNDDR